MITPVTTFDALELVSGDRVITDAITAIHISGHTPGSMTIMIWSAGEQAIIWGDVIVDPAQITEPDWPVVYDMDGEGARVTRNRLLDVAEIQGMVIAACHFPEPGFGRLIRVERKRRRQSM